MNKKSTKKNISIVMSLLLILTFVSCTKTDKETVLSPNVSEDIKTEENEVKLTLEKGHNFLKDGDFESAKSTYEKAISMDKTNKDIYLEIKDKYLAINRFDDALYFIQLSINNSTDIENMKAISDDIKANFQTDIFTKALYEGDNFTLPSELIAKINNEDISIPVTWNNSIVDTSTTGIFYFSGTNKEYSREFNATINVLPPVIVEEPVTVLDEEIAYIKAIYESNGKTYVDVHLVEFLRGAEALSAALEENPSFVLTNEDGSRFIANGYYIRDNHNTITTYELSDDTMFNLLPYDIDPFPESLPADSPDNYSAIPKPVTYDDFKFYIDKVSSGLKAQNLSTDRRLLSWIKTKNNIVYDISRQYTP